MTTQLFMIRHAESLYVSGAERTRGLTEQGQEAVRQVTAIMNEIRVDVVVSSPFGRAIMTVQGIADERGLEILTFEGLRERLITSPEQEVPNEERLAAIKRSFSDPDFAYPGGETTRQAAERAMPVIKDLLEQYRGQTIVMGTHGNMLTIILNQYDKAYDFTFWESTTMPDIYRLDFQGNVLAGVERLWK
ncbi:histidine phosphatase family protein [Paenibacillus solisilvae]|uniref:Histidine phosphatase family protein n=1 Tax=Paenibacillus solisilvae TaxID=2486751 RepID=A0ABW0VVA2_9BACL